MNRYGLNLAIVLLVILLATVAWLSFDAGREVVTTPQSVSAVIAAHNAGREDGGSPILWALILIVGLLVMVGVFRYGGDLVRQVRLTRKASRPQPQPIGDISGVRRAPRVQELPNQYPQLPAGHGGDTYE